MVTDPKSGSPLSFRKAVSATVPALGVFALAVLVYCSIVACLLILLWTELPVASSSLLLSVIVTAGSPLVALASIMLLPLAQSLGKRIFRRLRRRKPFIWFAVAAVSIAAASWAIILYARFGGDTDGILAVRRELFRWHTDSVEKDFAAFEGGRLAKSRFAPAYQAYAYSLAARRERLHPTQGKQVRLLDATAITQPVAVRAAGYLGLANLALVRRQPGQVQEYLALAESLTEHFSDGILHVTVLNEVAVLSQYASAYETDATRREDQLRNADRAYTKWFHASDGTDFKEQVQIRKGLAQVRALRNDPRGARRDLREIIEDIKAKLAEPGVKDVDSLRALLASVYTNLAVMLMQSGRFDAALKELNLSLATGAQDSRTARLNQLICFARQGNFSEGQRLADELRSSSRMLAERALFGLVQRTNADKMREYAIALGVDSFGTSSLNPQEQEQLASMCNEAFLGLDFEADDFALASPIHTSVEQQVEVPTDR